MGKNSMIGKTIGIATLVLGFLVAVVPHYVFPVCQYSGMMVETMGGTYLPMKCWYTAMTEVGLGAVIVLVGPLLILSKQAETRRALGFMRFFNT